MLKNKHPSTQPPPRRAAAWPKPAASPRRRRFLLVARQVAKVPPFLYEPPKRGLRPLAWISKAEPQENTATNSSHIHRKPLTIKRKKLSILI